MAVETPPPVAGAESDEFLGELRLGRRLKTPGQAAAGGLVLALGFLLLVTPHTVSALSTASVYSAALALVLLGLTLLNVLELLGGTGERGGTYFLVFETLDGLSGFLAGWAVLTSLLLVGVTLVRASAGQFLLAFPGIALDLEPVALALFAALAVGQLLRLTPRRELLWPLVLGLGAVTAFAVLRALVRVEPSIGRPTAEIGAPALLRGAGWIAAGYLSLEAIQARRRHILNPSRNVPRALGGTWVAALAGSVALAWAIARMPVSGAAPDGAEAAAALGPAFLAPATILAFLLGLASLLAASVCLSTGARQLHTLSQHGGLPAALRTVPRPFRLPPLVFATMLVPAAPLLLWAPQAWLRDGAAGLVLLTLILLNVGAIRSRSAEPQRRRPFRVAFHPVAPAAAVVLAAVAYSALPVSGILASLGWMVLGLVLYFGYARARQARAQVGVLVFGRRPDTEREEDLYRILVPLRTAGGRRLALKLATSLARELDGEVIPLQVITMADPLAIEEGQRIAREQNALLQWSTDLSLEAGVPTFPITRLALNTADGILDTAVEEKCDLILLSWSPQDGRRGGRLGPVLDPVVRGAACDVAVVAEKAARLDAAPVANGEIPSGLQLRRIFVPTAGGPHAPLASRFAAVLARAHGATAAAVYVADPDATEEERAQGRERIDATLAIMRKEAAWGTRDGEEPDSEEIQFETRLVVADSVADGIAKAAADADLVLIGSSEESLLDQVLFGTIAEEVARTCPAPVVVVRRHRALPRIWLKRAWDTVFQALPTLTRGEQVEVYKQVRRSARPDVDFFVMIGLAAIISTYGLLQDATAVIIGAMLVAPLFAPVLALGLSVVRGDFRLLRISVESTVKGIAVTVGMAAVLALISPLRAVTHEVAVRTQPNLFDLAIALASGAAGSYALARRDVATALPGVAIAVALLPPLGVVGIGLALADGDVARGGGLLFATNLIAIVLAGAVTFLLLGFRPAEHGEREARLRMGLLISAGLVVLITIPLAAVVVGTVGDVQTRHSIERVLVAEMDEIPDLELTSFEFRRDGPIIAVTATVYTPGDLSAAAVERLRSRLSEALDAPVEVELTAIPVRRIEAQ